MRLKTLRNTLALAAVAFGAPVLAHANIYSFNPEVITPTTPGSAAAYDPNSGTTDATFTDDFTFTLDAYYNASLGALFYEQTPAPNDVITEADLSLYSGLPGSGTLLSTTGFQPVNTNPGVSPAFITSGLSSGQYYLETSIVVPGGDVGDYSVSAFVASSAPEPSTWALMALGVGLLGVSLRSSRRTSAAVAA